MAGIGKEVRIHEIKPERVAEPKREPKREPKKEPVPA